jgi:uncharacterized protein (DUF2147 family)
MKKLITVIVLFYCKTLNAQVESDNLLGIWETETKDLKVEIFKKENKYFGKVIWFKCPPNGQAMDSYLDTKNPEKTNRTRKWLGMVSVENLTFNNDKYWKNGTIYDPHSGHTYSAMVKLVKPNMAIVRGFWAFEFLGRSMIFNRT